MKDSDLGSVGGRSTIPALEYYGLGSSGGLQTRVLTPV